MAPSRSFANYPAAKEAPDVAYRSEADKNPVLRGLPLVAVATLVHHSAYMQKLLWTNAGMGKLASLTGLEKAEFRFHPVVIPQLIDGAHKNQVNGQAPMSLLPFGPELQQPQAPDRSGRFYSAADYHQLYKSGQATPLQVVEALLPLVQRGQTPPSKYELAWLANNVDEILAAAKASTDRYAAGAPLGILDGVPIGVKCDVDMKGYITTVGMKVNKSYPFFTPATETAAPVRKLQEAGAIVIGQNQMHEIGMDTTGCNPSNGTPINWYNKSYYPGGSSSGGCSSLGAGLVPIAVGTDAGGSARIPPAFNGVYGLKPSHERCMPMRGTMCVIGPMAATVADLTIAYRTMAQPCEDDLGHERFALSVPPEPSAKKTLGVLREWVDKSTPTVRDYFYKVVEHFQTKLGYEVVDVELPYLREGQVAHAATCLVEACEAAKSRAPLGKSWSAMLNVPNRMLLDIGQHTPALDYMRYGQVRAVIMQHLAFLYEKHPGLLIVSPTTPTAGWKIHPSDAAYGFSDANMSILNMMYVWLSNSSGCPSVTCPMGYAEPEQGEGKVPMGVMAMGEWGAEEQLLAWAGDAEVYLHDVYPGGRLRPQEWADVLGLVKGSRAKEPAEEPHTNGAGA